MIDEKFLRLKARFPHRESIVAGRLGLSRDRVRELRQELLAEGDGWDMVGNRVCLSEEGYKRLVERLNSPGLPGASMPEESARPQAAARERAKILLLPAPPGWGEPVTLRVWRIPQKNTRVLECFLPGNDPSRRENIVTLRVATNVNFVRGMDIPCRRTAHDGVFELQGRCPRWRGRM